MIKLVQKKLKIRLLTRRSILLFLPPQPESKYDHTLSVVTYNIRGCRDDEGWADPAKIVQASATWEPRTLLDVTLDWNGSPLHVTTFTGSRVPKEIDRILLSRDLVFLHAQAPSIGPSDHYPVQMEIRKQFVDEKKALTLR
jgi:endonuclease/exonuclease/phosphatase family metal-dependent hydrolase